VLGSSSTASVAGALRAAAESAKQALIQLAVEDERSPLHGADVSYQDGDLVAAHRRIGFPDLLATTGTSSVEGTGNDTGGDASRYAFHSFGAHFCEIRVNRFIAPGPARGAPGRSRPPAGSPTPT
jgi:xanthine dehydrogenase YagR molybdenum-binding subunit